MDEAPLAGIRAKLDRADEHLEALTHEVRCFVDSRPNTYWAEVDADAGYYCIRVTINRPPPIRMAVICGDFAYCLRSALDHVAYAVVPPTTRRTVAFPICKTRHDFEVKVTAPGTKGKGPLPSLDPQGAAFGYIESVQPYHGPHGVERHQLWLLDKLCNADKHRAILTRACAHTPSPDGRVTGDGIVFVGMAEFVYNEPLGDGAKS